MPPAKHHLKKDRSHNFVSQGSWSTKCTSRNTTATEQLCLIHHLCAAMFRCLAIQKPMPVVRSHRVPNPIVAISSRKGAMEWAYLMYSIEIQPEGRLRLSKHKFFQRFLATGGNVDESCWRIAMAQGTRRTRRPLREATATTGQHVFQRLLPRLGYQSAIWAVAHRLCRLVWKILHEGVRFIEKGRRSRSPREEEACSDARASTFASWATKSLSHP